MADVQDAVDIGQSTDEREGALPSDTMALVVQEVQNLLVGMEQSLQGICGRIEDASTKQVLIEEFRPFDRIMRIFLEVEPDQEHEGSILEAVSSLEGSTYLQGMLDASASLGEAITGYKTAVAKDLAASLQASRRQASIDDATNSKLFSQFLPDPISDDAVVADDMLSTPCMTGKKRGVSSITRPDVFSRIPKRRSTIPALASLQRAVSEGQVATPSKKNILLTREKLRAGLHDPKGLLDLVGSSTNALERTKKLELLKSSGLLVKHQGSRSFSDKLNDAGVRLDLGLGGQAVSDTLTFGAKVLSSPGFLSNRNISDVENGIVEAKTT